MKIRPFVQLLAIAGGALAFLPLQAQAASCSVNQVTINKIEVTPLDGQGIVYQAPPPLTSTGCVFVDGQNDTGTLLPTISVNCRLINSMRCAATIARISSLLRAMVCILIPGVRTGVR